MWCSKRQSVTRALPSSSKCRYRGRLQGRPLPSLCGSYWSSLSLAYNSSNLGLVSDPRHQNMEFIPALRRLRCVYPYLRGWGGIVESTTLLLGIISESSARVTLDTWRERYIIKINASDWRVYFKTVSLWLTLQLKTIDFQMFDSLYYTPNQSVSLKSVLARGYNFVGVFLYFLKSNLLRRFQQTREVGVGSFEMIVH